MLLPNRLFLAVLGCALTVAPALGQATFALRNHYGGFGLDAPVYDWNGGLLTGATWRAELYGGPETGSLAPVLGLWNQQRGTAALRFPGYFHSDDEWAVFSVPVGGSAWLQLKVWDSGLGTTYEETVAKGLGGYGQSELFYARGGNPAGSPPDLPAPLVGLQSFSVLEVIPEPGVGVLLLAALVVLVFAARSRTPARR